MATATGEIVLTAELHAMLSDATGALARLDADALEGFSLRAVALERRGRRPICAGDGAELTARLRVFAAAMQATRDNLHFMEAIVNGPGCDVSSTAVLSRGLRWDR